MRAYRKILLFLLLLVCGGVLLLCLPLLVIIAQDMLGAVINPPYSVCENFDEDAFKEALRKGLNVNSGCCQENMIGECSLAHPNSTHLIYAVESGDTEAVKRLVEHGAQINDFTAQGCALSVAARRRDPVLVQYLLDHGADTASSKAALTMAAHLGYGEIARTILGRLVSETQAAECHRLACQLSEEVNQPGRGSQSPQGELLLHLIQNCLDPNVRCWDTQLITLLARKDDYAVFVEALLEKGADLTRPEKNGKNVLQYLQSFYDYHSRPKIREILEKSGDKRP